jgi:hypothetical protein
LSRGRLLCRFGAIAPHQRLPWEPHQALSGRWVSLTIRVSRALVGGNTKGVWWNRLEGTLLEGQDSVKAGWMKRFASAIASLHAFLKSNSPVIWIGFDSSLGGYNRLERDALVNSRIPLETDDSNR